MYDQFHDPGFQFLNTFYREFPDARVHIKEASIDPEENEKRAEYAFGWPSRRLFPLDTRGDAVLSRMYAEKQAEVPVIVRARVDKACRMFGVGALPPQEKVASAPDDDDEFLLPEIRRFRVTSSEHVKLASEAIRTNLRKMNIETRARVAVNLVKKAAEFQQAVPPLILKLAGTTLCDTHILRDWIYARMERTGDPQIYFGFQKLAEATHSLPRLVGDRAELIKVAASIQELDKAAKLEGRYDVSLLDPLSTVFNTEKVADDFLDLAGHPVALDQLLSISPETYADAFGEDLAEEFSDKTAGTVDPQMLRVILPTVPYDLQRALAMQVGI